ncbi:hypothetical protein HK099_000135, partial [Clydaea vesicula]
MAKSSGDSNQINSRLPNNCKQCLLPINGEYITAAGNKGFFHTNCFRCFDCHELVAEKFFPLTDQDGTDRIYCENDYFRRLDLLCAKCGSALRGPHINALGKKYHLDHFTCSICPVSFKQRDKYFEQDGKVYCQDHYSVLFAARCGGCQTAVLKNFVEMNRDETVEQWHPECYIIFKLWNVKIASSKLALTNSNSTEVSQEVNRHKNTADKACKILHVLSAFEESSAECIQEMLIHFSNQNLQQGIIQAEKFICHIEALFLCLDSIDLNLVKFKDSIGINLVKEPKHLAKKIVHFFTRLSQQTNPNSNRDQSTTQLIELVTNLARELKSLIRSALKGALKLDRVYSQSSAIDDFLSILIALGEIKPSHESGIFSLNGDETSMDLCVGCQKAVEEANICFQNYHWHKQCFKCNICNVDISNSFLDSFFDVKFETVLCNQHQTANSKNGFECITQLQQYIFLLRCALKRLCSHLKVTIDASTVENPCSVSEKIRKSNEQLSIMEESGVTPKLGTTEQKSTYGDNLAPRSSSLFSKDIQQNGSFKASNPSPLAIPPPTQPTMIPSSSLPLLQQSFPESPSTQRAPSSISPKNVLLNSQSSPPPYASPLANSSKRIPLSDLGTWEHLVVKNLAVVKLHGLMSNYFSTQEMANFVFRKKTVWEKMVKSIISSDKNSAKIKEGTFGVSLETLVDKCSVTTTLGPKGCGSFRIPYFIDASVKLLLTMDISSEGIFRKNGNIKRLKEVTDDLDRDPFNFNCKDDNPIQIAALIKKFFREMPEPLLTWRLHKLFITAMKLSDEAVKKEALQYILCLLPKQNIDLLVVLMWLLNIIFEQCVLSENSAANPDDTGGNKMSIKNLATVFAPNILASKSKNLQDDDNNLGIEVIKLLLTYQNDFWLVPENIMVSINEGQGDNEKEREILKKYEEVIVSM